MNTVMEFDYEKATQAINYLAVLEGGKINKMKSIKLIWLADRYHLRKFGRPITNDVYMAMPYGPVASSVKDIAEFSEFLSENERGYASVFLSIPEKYIVNSIKEPDLDVFSDTDVEAIRLVYDNFKSLDEFQLADFSHHYPEWKKHEGALKTSSRAPMNYKDFFENPVGFDDSIFSMDEAGLFAAKESFEHNIQVAEIWK